MPRPRIGQWFKVGTLWCIVVDVFNTSGDVSACEVVTNDRLPTLHTAVDDGHGEWRFLDSGQVIEAPGPLDDFVSRLRKGRPLS